jgi:hypothetical protein
MKTFNIEIPKGYEIDQKKSTFEKIVFKEIKKGLPKTWEELIRVEGYYLTTCSAVGKSNGPADDSNRNLFSNQELAEAALAMAQLSQLRDAYRQGWKPDWQNAGTKKYVIFYEDCQLKTDYWYTRRYFLSFESAGIAQEFLANFKDLIEKAIPLMS